MKVAVHRGGLDELLGEWETLHAAAPAATPFLSAAWAAAWWPHYGDGASPFVVTVHEGGDLVGLAPLVVRRRGPVRVLQALGSEPGDYWDVVARPEAREAACGAVAEALRRRAGQWDALLVRCLPPDSPFPAAAEAAGLRRLAVPGTPAPAIELPASFDEYLATLSSNRRSNLRKHLRRLDSGEVELREVRGVRELPAALERWQEFRRRQWASQGKDINPEHLSDRFRALMLGVVTALLPAGGALVWEFARDGEVVGTYVNFADSEAFFWWLGGFDPAVAALGLGKIAIGHGIRTSIEVGRRRYDFARGPEPYKYWYGASDRMLPGVLAGSRRPRSRAVLLGGRGALALRERRRLDQDGPS